MQAKGFVWLSEPRIPVYDDPWVIMADVPCLVGKVYDPCRVSIYSNSRVRGHGRLVMILQAVLALSVRKLVMEKGEMVIVPGRYRLR